MPAQDLSKDDARELLEIDVRHVSGVSTPATGIGFVLSKQQKEEQMSDQGQTNQPMTQENIFATIGKNLARAFGVQPADDALTQASDALATIAKASGMAPADDAGGGRKPAYPNPAYPSTGSGIPNTNTGTPSVASSAPATKATQQPTVDLGRSGTGGTPGSDTTMGTPVTKSMIDEFLNRIEKDALNPEALAEARTALAEAFQPQDTEQMNREETTTLVKEIVLTALEPVAEEIDKLNESNPLSKSDIEGMVKEAVEEQFEKLNQKIDALTAVVSGKDQSTKAAKSRVPATTEPAAKSVGVWAGSPFDIQA